VRRRLHLPTYLLGVHQNDAMLSCMSTDELLEVNCDPPTLVPLCEDDPFQARGGMAYVWTLTFLSPGRHGRHFPLGASR